MDKVSDRLVINLFGDHGYDGKYHRYRFSYDNNDFEFKKDTCWQASLFKEVKDMLYQHLYLVKLMDVDLINSLLDTLIVRNYMYMSAFDEKKSYRKWNKDGTPDHFKIGHELI